MPGVHRPPAIRARALALLADGWSLRAVGRELDVHHSTVSWWRDGGGAERQTREEVVRWSDASARQRDAWAYLFGMYLGDGHIDATGRLRIFCDASYPGIIGEVDLALRTLEVDRPWHARQPGCRVVGAVAMGWDDALPTGRGPKHQYRLPLAPWHRQAIDTRPHLVLRGLVQSDGCRFVNRVVSAAGRLHEYPSYDFSNRSEEIHGVFASAARRVGVEPRHRPGKPNSRVARRQDVATFDLFIGPKR